MIRSARKYDDLLRRKQLNATASRRKILSIFFDNRDALAHADVEKYAGDKFDRVTIYRTLQTFVDKGILHTIPTPENAVLYALCKDCEEGHHHDDHVHFVCDDCGKTICLDDVVSPKVDLPVGYEASNVEVLITGKCSQCTGSAAKHADG